jgi:hypothetical protein
MVLWITRRFDCCLNHMGWCRKVGLSCAETDNRFSRGLEGLCSGIDRKGRRFRDGGDTARETLWGHGGFLGSTDGGARTLPVPRP